MTTARRARFSSSRGKDPKALEVKGNGRWLIELSPLLQKNVLKGKARHRRSVHLLESLARVLCWNYLKRARAP